MNGIKGARPIAVIPTRGAHVNAWVWHRLLETLRPHRVSDIFRWRSFRAETNQALRPSAVRILQQMPQGPFQMGRRWTMRIPPLRSRLGGRLPLAADLRQKTISRRAVFPKDLVAATVGFSIHGRGAVGREMHLVLAYAGRRVFC